MPRSLATRELLVNGKVMRVTYPYGWERAKRATNGSTLAARHCGKGASRVGAAEKYRFPWARSSCLNIWTTRHAYALREAKKKPRPRVGRGWKGPTPTTLLRGRRGRGIIWTAYAVVCESPTHSSVLSSMSVPLSHALNCSSVNSTPLRSLTMRFI